MKIAHKLIIGSLLLTSLIWAVGLYAASVSRRAMQRSIETNSSMLATGIMAEVDRAIHAAVDDWLIYSAGPLVHRTIEASNRQFEKLADVQGYLDTQDRAWRAAPSEKPTAFMERLIANELSEAIRIKLRAFERDEGYRAYGEVFVTNRYGANVAQTGRTTDYRQDDEEWWRRARQDGVYVADVQYDESAGIHSADICVRIDGDNGEFIGVLKAVFDIQGIFAILRSRSTDWHLRAGHQEECRLLLVQADGRILFPSDPSSIGLADGSRYLPEPDQTGTEHPHAFHRHDEEHRGVLATCAVSQGQDEFQSLGWILVVEHRAEEIWAPAVALRADILLISAAVTVAGLTLGLGFSVSMCRRIARLKNAVLDLGKGNLNVTLDDQGSDEIGQLGRTFNRMTQELSETLVSKTALEKVVQSLQSEVAERKRAEEELEQAKSAAEEANRAKSKFLANMSHEIRTPLTAILGYGDLMTDPDLTASDRDNHLAVIRRNGEHLLELINDILDLSKIEAGRLEMDVQPCRYLYVVSDVASLMRVRASQRGNSLSVECAGPLPETIHTDGARLRQALVNLVGNAVKFTENGSVRVALAFLPDGCDGQPAVRISVIDTGVGISPDKLAGLFDPFAQADASTSRKYGGTGLGLAITRHIADLLGGSLAAESTPGQGSAFTLTVPTGPLDGVRMLEDPDEALQCEGPHPGGRRPGDSALAGLKVLLAEDGLDNQRLIGTVLRKAGAEVEIAANGKIAVEKVAAAAGERGFDVILMDIQMPEMDGYQATSTIRKAGYAGPILALTAHAMAGDRRRCLEAGCDDHLAKPIDRARLVRAVAERAGNQCDVCDVPAGRQARPEDEAQGAVLSQFADDPDLAEVIDEFVAGLEGHVEAMRRTLNHGDHDELTRRAHQLKGAGGSYGYPVITETAKMLEDAAKARDIEAATLALGRLASLCRAAARGRPRADAPKGTKP